MGKEGGSEKMSLNLIYFFCGMFAGALMEFIIAAVIIMKGDRKK